MKKVLIASLTVLAILSTTACEFKKQAHVNVNVGSNQPASVTIETNSGDETTTVNLSSDQPATVTVEPNTDEETSDQAGDVKITDDEALEAIKNRCLEENPDLENMIDEGYMIYWNVESSDDAQIVVLYRAYTGAEIRYYIDRTTGDTYVTEFVSGITEEEEKTGETFNIKD